MHLDQLKKEVDALKAQQEEMVRSTAEKVLASALDDFNNRLTAIEKKLKMDKAGE